MAADLRAELEALRRALAASTPGDSHTLRDRLAALARRADENIAELAQVRDVAAELAESGTRPGSAEPPRREDHLGASTYLEKGWHLLAAGDHPGAVRMLTTALQFAPGDAQAAALLGWAQLLQGRLDEATGTLTSVLERDPANALARVNMAFISLQQGVFGQAIENLARVIRENRDRKAVLYAHYYLGLVYLERGMLEDATVFLSRALEIGPNLVEARYALGRALWSAGQAVSATAAWTAGASGGPSSWALRCREALDLVASGEEVPRFSLL
jgi:tetratricopeptide (TPR) repeat protein